MGEKIHVGNIPGIKAKYGGPWMACWSERRIRDRKAASSNPGRSGGRSPPPRPPQELTLCAEFNSSISVVPTYVTAVTRKRTRSFYRKCRWQVKIKHACILDPTKSDCADYAAVPYQETSSQATRHGTPAHSRLSSPSHYGLILA